MSESFNLSWSNFESAALQTVQNLFSDTELVDVTLASEDDKQIKAHKVILCAASPVFKRIITNNPHQHPLLFLRNIDIKTLKSIIRFIYMGQTEVEQEELETFLAVAKDLKVKGLSNEMDTKQSSETYSRQSSEKDTRTPNGMDTKHSSENEMDTRQSTETETKQLYEMDARPVNEVATNTVYGNEVDTEYDLADVYISCKAETKECLQEENSVGDLEVENNSFDEIFAEHSENSTVGSYSKCVNCDYKANTSQALKVHDDAIHKGVRYPCGQCDYKATQKSSLNRHMKRHTQH
jgi:hypothetical protein